MIPVFFSILDILAITKLEAISCFDYFICFLISIVKSTTFTVLLFPLKR